MTYTTPLQNLLEKSKLHPNKVFLNQPVNGQWHQYTWMQVEQQARKIAAGLKAQDYPKDTRIGILSKNCAEWFIADLAIMMTGLISVPIYPTANKNTIETIIQHCEMKAIFVGLLDSFDAAEQAIDKTILRIAFPYPTIKAKNNWERWLSQYPPLDDLHFANITDTATIIYTSGTTGEPKGVVLSFKNWAAAVQNTAKIVAIKPNDHCVSYLPLAHITERCIIEGGSLSEDVTVFFIESIDTFIANLKHAKPNIFLSVPRLWSKFKSKVLIKFPQKRLAFLLKIPFVGKLVAYKIRAALGLNHVHTFGSGTAPISIDVLEWYQSIGIEIGEGWGMTESSGVSCANMPFNAKYIGTIGSPIDCLEMKLSKDSEILIRGDSVFEGYYLNPQATEEAFTDGWFHTGDVGELTQEGVYKITGRIKEQFKTSKGKYVAPAPIENLLLANHNIEQVMVMGSGLKQPVALINLVSSADRNNPKLSQSLEKTLNSVNQQLESHEKLDYLMVCSEIWTVKSEMLTPSLKIKRRVLESHYQDLLPESFDDVILWQ